jgi:aminopeptidase YwaD
VERISEGHLERHLRRLTCDIGVRLAGTAEETAACEYVADEFRATGADVAVETFPVNVRRVQSQRLEVCIAGSWHEFACSLFSSTPGTQGMPVEAPIVFFEAPTDYQRSDLSHLRGKAVVHLGTHIESREHYRHLMDVEPAFLLIVDIRYPGTTPLADGMFPAYTQALGARPSVNVAFMDAWRWKVEGATSARLIVDGGMEPGASSNVIATLPGADDDGDILYLSAHHDTQADSPGADDNASGVSGLLELARVLAPLPRQRTVRLISFGAEEQLSVGSACYVRSHRGEIARRGRLMFNLDSYSSWLGWTEIVCNGPGELESYLKPFFGEEGIYPRFNHGIVPYADHFPFVAAGIPGLYLGRHNCTGGRFFNHRPDDDMSRVSLPVMASHVSSTARVMADAMQRETLPFEPRIPEGLRDRVELYWSDLFGGW